jgi:hypothetical protein
LVLSGLLENLEPLVRQKILFFNFALPLVYVNHLGTFMTSRLITFSFVLFVHFSFGQHKIDWAKYDCAVFKEDTTFGFATSNYYKAQYHFPPKDITESSAVLEIRVFPILHHIDDLEDFPKKIFQFYEDSAVLTEYYLEEDPEFENFIKKYKDSSGETYTKAITPLLEKTGGRLWRIVRKPIPVNEAENMIAELTKMNLFTIDKEEEVASAENKIMRNPNYARIIKDYKIGKQQIREVGAVFEIKYKNKYRVFQARTVSFYYYGEKTWEQLEIITIGSELVKYLMPNLKI